MREQLIQIFNNTMEYIDSSDEIKDLTNRSKKNTEVIMGREIFPQTFRPSTLSNVTVSSRKTFEAAKLLKESHPDSKVAVLNFASATNPGGGVKNGSSAQEEDLCRCSNLYPCLTSNKVFKNFYEPNRKNSDRTSLHTDDIVYSPDIVVIRDDVTYELLHISKFYHVDVISCAAPNLREHPANKYNPDEKPAVDIATEELYILHVNRAKNILEAAISHGVEYLVLGAFGCGAFRNDPVVVANAYYTVLREYADKFKGIEFAVYCKPSNTYNYEVFERKFRDYGSK